MGNMAFRVFLVFFLLQGTSLKAIDETALSLQTLIALKEYQLAEKNLPIGDTKLDVQTRLFFYAIQGQDQRAVKEWQLGAKRFPELFLDDRIVEELALSTIRAASFSPYLLPQLMAVHFTRYCRDLSFLSVIKRGLLSDYELVRQQSIETALVWGHADLDAAICQLLAIESSQGVLEEAVRYCGVRKLKDAEPFLWKRLTSVDDYTISKSVLAASLMTLFEDMDEAYLAECLNSPYPGVRLLASKYLGTADFPCNKDQLVSLLEDPYPELRANVLVALMKQFGRGTEEQSVILELLLSASNDKYFKVALTAAWGLGVLGDHRGLERLEAALKSPELVVQRFAAVVIAQGGTKCVSLMQDYSQVHPDAYVRLHLLLGMLTQGVSEFSTLKNILEILQKEKETWTWKQFSCFSQISCLRGRASHTKRRLLEDSDIRMNILRLLVAKGCIEAEEEMKRRLLESSGIEALLVKDYFFQVKNVVNLEAEKDIHSLLLLASRDLDLDLLLRLIELYPDLSVFEKEQVLMILGSSHYEEARAFLTQRLMDPKQSMRVIAAVALWRNING